MSTSEPDDDDDEKSIFVSGSMVTAATNVHQACAIYRLAKRLRSVLGPEHDVRARLPIEVGNFIIPDPALVIVKAREDDYRHRHPTVEDILLLIEVVSGLDEVDQDRYELYQEHQVVQVWTIDLNSGLIDAADNIQEVTTLHCPSDRVFVPGTTHSLAVKDLIP